MFFECKSIYYTTDIRHCILLTENKYSLNMLGTTEKIRHFQRHRVKSRHTIIPFKIYKTESLFTFKSTKYWTHV